MDRPGLKKGLKSTGRNLVYAGEPFSFQIKTLQIGILLKTWGRRNTRAGWVLSYSPWFGNSPGRHASHASSRPAGTLSFPPYSIYPVERKTNSCGIVLHVKG